VANAARRCLETGEFDFLWVTFVAAHIAGHQLWRESVDAPPAADGQEPSAVAAIYERVDHAVGQLLDALPSTADVVLFSANGMGPETSRADLLPAMLARVLGGPAATRSARSATSPAWRLRAAVPTSVRASVANLLPDRFALRLAGRLEGAGIDWRTTRAFAPPSDGPGFVRVNLKGRERDGIVDPAAAASLLEEISAGLRTFVDPRGEPVVAAILRPSDVAAPGPRSDVLPDLLIIWNEKPECSLRSVSSTQFGDVPRRGVGSGRAGNHPGPTWATVVPGPARHAVGDVDSAEAIDIAATVCKVMGVAHDDLPGRSLLQ
jgi:predicted AlkP superfamily phosphohydrolase/phosphomutase